MTSITLAQRIKVLCVDAQGVWPCARRLHPWQHFELIAERFTASHMMWRDFSDQAPAFCLPPLPRIEPPPLPDAFAHFARVRKRLAEAEVSMWLTHEFMLGCLPMGVPAAAKQCPPLFDSDAKLGGENQAPRRGYRCVRLRYGHLICLNPLCRRTLMERAKARVRLRIRAVTIRPATGRWSGPGSMYVGSKNGAGACAD